VQNEGGPSILQKVDTSASTIGHQFWRATTNAVTYLNGLSLSWEEDVEFIKTLAARRKLDFKPVKSDESSEQSSGSFQAADYGRVIVSGEKVAAKKSGACAAAGCTSQKVAFRFNDDAGSPAISRRAPRDKSDNEQQGRRNEERDAMTLNANMPYPTSSGDSTPPVNLSTPAPESPEDDTDEEVEPLTLTNTMKRKKWKMILWKVLLCQRNLLLKMLTSILFTPSGGILLRSIRLRNTRPSLLCISVKSKS
jgi:hypothetical protein